MADTPRPSDRRAAAALVRDAYRAHLPEGKGFLPAAVPADRLPAPLAPYLRACEELPRRFGAPGGVRPWLGALFARNDPAVARAIDGLGAAEEQALMTALCVLAHAYRWGTSPPDRAEFALTHLTLPEGMDRPWTRLARRLGQPRVGTLWNLMLCNWRLAGKPGGSPYTADEATVGGLRLAHGWLLPPYAAQLERFVLTFVETEARGAAVVDECVALIAAAAREDSPAVLRRLQRLRSAIEAMNGVFYRNIRTAVLDPGVWAERIQPTFAWGLEGDGGPLEGASGLQLGAVQCADATLGVEGETAMGRAAGASRRYMPEPHRRFLAALDGARPLVRGFVRERGDAALTRCYDGCVGALAAWRRAHQRRGQLYLGGASDPGGTGRPRLSTGLSLQGEGDPVEGFEATMQQRIDETRRAALGGPVRAAAGERGGRTEACGLGRPDPRPCRPCEWAPVAAA